MKKELLWLGYTTVMTAVFWMPYILNRIKEIGLAAIMDLNADTEPHALWAKRMMSAHRNAVENLVIFASLVLSLNAVGVSTHATVLATMIYFYARLIHFIVYAAGVPLLRTLAFVTGFICQMVLGYTLLMAI